jgi:hypothetical protein
MPEPEPAAAGGKVSFSLLLDAGAGGAGEVRRFTLDSSKTVKVGRSPKSDIVVGLPNVSWMHLELRLLLRDTGHELVICDTSSNGTGLKHPGKPTRERLEKDVPMAVTNGAIITLPMKVKAGPDPEAQRTSIRVLLDGHEADTPVTDIASLFMSENGPLGEVPPNKNAQAPNGPPPPPVGLSTLPHPTPSSTPTSAPQALSKASRPVPPASEERVMHGGPPVASVRVPPTVAPPHRYPGAFDV